MESQRFEMYYLTYLKVTNIQIHAPSCILHVHVPACTVLYCRAQEEREREGKGGGGKKIHVTAPRRSPRRGPAETAPRSRFEIKDQGHRSSTTIGVLLRCPGL